MPAAERAGACRPSPGRSRPGRVDSRAAGAPAGRAPAPVMSNADAWHGHAKRRAPRPRAPCSRGACTRGAAPGTRRPSAARGRTGPPGTPSRCPARTDLRAGDEQARRRGRRVAGGGTTRRPRPARPATAAPSSAQSRTTSDAAADGPAAGASGQPRRRAVARAPPAGVVDPACVGAVRAGGTPWRAVRSTRHVPNHRYPSPRPRPDERHARPAEPDAHGVSTAKATPARTATACTVSFQVSANRHAQGAHEREDPPHRSRPAASRPPVIHSAAPGHVPADELVQQHRDRRDHQRDESRPPRATAAPRRQEPRAGGLVVSRDVGQQHAARPRDASGRPRWRRPGGSEPAVPAGPGNTTAPSPGSDSCRGWPARRAARRTLRRAPRPRR